MREVNFSIPNANKASVGITTALYDRRALDCTSTLPLINSLNNLAYLTTSSGRIRDILTVDGGIERLVCILKGGRSNDMMEMWKWNLAFQCIVNIGIRGSESVRTRVVEADMVPVIATILDNYFQVLEKTRERLEAETRHKCPFSSKSFSRSSNRGEAVDGRPGRARRHPPPPRIAIPTPSEQADDEPTSEVTPTISTANLSLSSPPERTTFSRQHHHNRSLGARAQFSPPSVGSNQPELPMSALPLQSNTSAAFVRPVRDADRLPSMLPAHHFDLSSQPQSPATPSGPSQRPMTARATTTGERRRRPSIRHQLSISGSDDDGQIEESALDETTDDQAGPEPMVGIQADIIMRDIVDDESLLEQQRNSVTLGLPDVSSTDDDTFNITHRTSLDGSNLNLTATPTQAQITQPQLPPQINALNAAPSNLQQPLAWLPSRFSSPGSLSSSNLLAAMPREEDVLMSLQLLAYVSKYCNLRSYFQQTHLVPRLKIDRDLYVLDTNPLINGYRGPTKEELEDDWDNEFVAQPGEQPYNIFPLIEKFTAKSSSRHAHNPTSPQQTDMQYWAGVVMRNLCRKDDSRGGIRQCAYWQCGKWEEYTRQFAKCRRCRRTKYCSKECQKGAWGSHRFWCVAADETREGEPGSSDRHHHRHHRSHHH